MMSCKSESYDFAQLFDAYNKRFVAYAAGYVGRGNAEDMVMDAFLYYWERRTELDQSNPAAYILSTVRHRCLNHLRGKKVRSEAAGKLTEHASRILGLQISTLEALDPETIFPDNIQSRLDRAVDSLPERTREVFILIRIHGHTYKEVAEKLSMTVKSVEFELTKAIRLLRGILK